MGFDAPERNNSLVIIGRGPIEIKEFLRVIFVGRTGLRAGWSLLAFFAVIFVVAFAIGWVFNHFHFPAPANEIAPGPALYGESVLLAMVLAATAVMARVERKSVLGYGFLDRRAIPRLAGGFAIGVLAFSTVVGIEIAGGWLVLDHFDLGGANIFRLAGLWLVATLLIALTEEAMFRGYLLHTLARGWNFWTSALFTSLLFGAVHITNKGYSWNDAAHIAAGGLLLALSLRTTGSLFWAVGFHAAWDWTGLVLYGVDEKGVGAARHLLDMHSAGNPLLSGGDGGADDSMLTFVILLAVGVGIWLYWRKPKDPPVA